MPRGCVVPKCSINTSKSIKEEGTVSTFKIPTEEKLRDEWLKAIPRKNWTPSSNSSVCIKHFQKSDLIQNDSRIKLKEGAVPSIFPGLPNYLSKRPKLLRTDPTYRKERHFAQEENKIKEFLQADIIQNYNEFLKNYKTKINLMEWKFIFLSDGICFYQLDVQSDAKFNDTSGINIVSNIIINNEMFLKVFSENYELSQSELDWLFPKYLKLERWSQFENLLSRYSFRSLKSSDDDDAPLVDVSHRKKNKK